LHAASLPKFDLFFFGFIFLIPLIHALETQKVKNAFWLFFRFSFLSYLLILYWIPNVMVRYGRMSQTLSILAIILLAAFLSLFTGGAGTLIKKILILRRGDPIRGLLIIPFIWVSKELVVEKIFGGFPWCSPGYSQYKNIYLAQTAEIGGIHLVTFIVIYFNILLYLLIRSWTQAKKVPPQPQPTFGQFLKSRVKGILAAILISVIGIYTTGYFLYRFNENKTSKLPFHTAGILQPNTRNDQVFNWKQKNEKLDEFFYDSKELMEKGAEFVIWPEFTISIYPLQDKFYYNRFKKFVKDNVPVLAGFTDFKGYKEIYNSLILFEKETFQKYDKVHLTPFGEYILFRDILFFVKRITDEIGDFTPGEKVHNLLLNNHLVSTPICYELIFPELVREFIVKGGEAIIIASNDSWYGDTSAPYQLLAMSTFRSIENRRYILRSTTNGISALIAPSGEILYQSPFNTKETLTAKFKYIKRKTIFIHFGYLFPYFCFIFFLIYFGIQKKIHRKRTKAGL
jgi:apolipoprotein N-acyltransferase